MRPPIHHRDAVGQAQRLCLIVRHEDRGDADLALDLAQLVPHLLAKLLVERGQRLVEQQHARRVHERPRQRRTLLHAPGQLTRPPTPSPARRTSASASPTRRRISASATRRSRNPNATFSNTDM